MGAGKHPPYLLTADRLKRGMQVSKQLFDTLPGALQKELLEVQSRKRRSWVDEAEINPFTGRRYEL